MDDDVQTHIDMCVGMESSDTQLIDEMSMVAGVVDAFEWRTCGFVMFV